MTRRRHDETEPAAEPVTNDDGAASEATVEPAAEATAEPTAEGTAEPAPPAPCAEETLRRERDEALDKWLRAVAEMDNLRKRTRREVTDARRFAQADALRGFLDVLDNLERALQTGGAATDTDAPDPFREGVELIRQKFRSVLQEQGVTPIEALGLHLDPLVHEAVGQLPREGSEPGTIIEVAQAGYRLGELVLRPARVIICA